MISQPIPNTRSVGRAIDLALEAHGLQEAADAARGMQRAGLSFRAKQVRELVRVSLAGLGSDE